MEEFSEPKIITRYNEAAQPVYIIQAAFCAHFIANFFAPLITRALGLPKEAVIAITIGFLRKDVAMGMLSLLDSTAKQLVVGSVVLAMFFPCIATFVILFKELGLKNLIKTMAIMVIGSFLVGSILNLIL